jgi:hypothetical protein
MEPAYHIALTATQKRMIAELAATQSQIEWLMQLTVMHLLEVSGEAARVIMGSTSLAANAQIWISVVREKHPEDGCRAWAEVAFKQMSDLAKSRNDYLHSVYGYGETADDISFMFSHVIEPTDKVFPTAGIRVKTLAIAPLSRLRAARDQAARLTVILAHIEWEASPEDFDASPFLRRLGGRHPPTSPTARPRKAKAL